MSDKKCLQIHLKSLYPILMVIAQGDSFGRFCEIEVVASHCGFFAQEIALHGFWCKCPRPMSGYLKTVKELFGTDRVTFGT